MGLAKRDSPSSIQPKEHTRGGIQTDPCLTIGTFPELNPWALDIEKKIETKPDTQPYTLVCHGVSAAAYN